MGSIFGPQSELIAARINTVSTTEAREAVVNFLLDLQKSHFILGIHQEVIQASFLALNWSVALEVDANTIRLTTEETQYALHYNMTDRKGDPRPFFNRVSINILRRLRKVIRRGYKEDL